MRIDILKNKKIAIVGGGPGGLTLARLLQIAGLHVKVYERDLNKDARVQGATLDLHEESGLEALRKAGLIEAFYENYRPGAGKLRVMDKYASIKMDWHEMEDFEEHRPEIDRGPLRKILLDSIQPGTIVWASNFVSMTACDDGWLLEFKNHGREYADIVIGADGANSKIRPFLTGIKPFFAGITAIEGIVYNAETASPQIHQLLKGGKIFAFGNDKSLIAGAKGDGSFAFYASFKTKENWTAESNIDFTNRGQVLNWFKHEFSGWDKLWYEMFENAEPNFTPRPQYCMPLDQSWETQSNLTMLGDAAHLMPPYAGEGVNMAMLDALELSNFLTGNEFPDTRSAIAHYEKQMCKRATEAAQMSLDSMEMLHAPDSITNLLEMFGGFGVMKAN